MLYIVEDLCQKLRQAGLDESSSGDFVGYHHFELYKLMYECCTKIENTRAILLPDISNFYITIFNVA